MRQLLSVFLLLLSFSSKSQIQEFRSSSAIVQNQNFEIEHISRHIVFTDTTIAISNWLNGNQEVFELKIDSTVKKELSLEGMCRWYYCTSLKKDIFNGFSKVIVLIPETDDKIEVYTFADEVNVYHTNILIAKN